MDNSYEYKLTAVVLVYNGMPFLDKCLECLVEQTLDGLEILLINDVSTDDSLSICRSFEKEYDNVFIIDKEVNEGLATNANIGISKARGEYVILVDNDDIIPLDAYEKLYNKAKETDSDICLGRANLLIGRSQYEMDFHETSAWSKERTINDVSEFPQVFHDAFYWNKIMRTEFLRKNDIKLPIGMIYADRNFSHTAYTYADRISIIPDCVYMWRQRDNSLSMKRKELSNYINRIDSYELDLDFITNHYPDYFKILLRRIIIPIKGLLYDEEFEELVFTRVRDIIIKYSKNIDNLYDNDMSDLYNLMVYLILENRRKELKLILSLDLSKAEVVNKNNKSYWTHPLIREHNLDIPEEFLEIHFASNFSLNMKRLHINDERILFDRIELPKYLEIENCYVVFKGKTNRFQVYEDNIFYFKAEKIEDGDNNLYKVEVPLESLNPFEFYDIHFRVDNIDNISNEFRLKSSSYSETVNESEYIRPFFTNNENLVILSQHFDDEFIMEYDSERIRMVTANEEGLNKLLKCFFMKDATTEKVHLTFNEEKTEFELEWKFFLDRNSEYSMHLITYNNNFRLVNEQKFKDRYLKDFKDITFKKDDMTVKIYSTSSGDIRIKTD